MKRRRLADLYVTGRPCVIDDGMGESVTIWMQKPSPVEEETCIRRANAARARALMIRRDRDSEEWQSVYAEIEDVGDRDWMISYLISDDVQERKESIEARVGGEPEWEDDSYLQGLYDAWEGSLEEPGLKEDFARDPEHEEAKRCFLEMKRFSDTINEFLDAETVGLRAKYDEVDDESLHVQVVERWLTARANSAWLRELNLSELYFAVREPEDHSHRYFDRREDLDLLAPEVLGRLRTEYSALTVDPLEGKDSGATDTSSSVFAQPATEDPASPSGPVAAAQ